MQNSFNHALLSIARHARGWSQTELSRRSGISQVNLSRFENRLTKPDDDRLNILCKTLGFPLDFFYQNERIIGLPVSIQYSRRHHLGQKARLRLEAEINIRLLHIRKLMEETEFQPQLDLPCLDLEDHGGYSEHVADLLRRSWLVPSGPIDNFIDFIEGSGVIIIQDDFASLGVDCLTIELPNLPPCIFLDKNLLGDRQRFVLAHEIGHLVMHQMPDPDMEKEADRFARALLMPECDIRSSFSVRRLTIQHLASLKQIWKFPMKEILYRAMEIGAITKNHFNDLRREIISIDTSSVEPGFVDIEPEIPFILSRMIKLHVEDLEYGISGLAKMLCSNEDDFRRAYGFPEKSRPNLRLVK